MLLSNDKLNEELANDESIRVTVVDVRGSRGSLGVNAPRQAPLCRQEEWPGRGNGVPGRLPPATRRPGVLVVDDEVALRKCLAAGLDREGFAVWAADGGLAAVELFCRDGDAIDVALVDVRMPGMDGPATLRALRRLSPSLPCCLMTGNPEPYTEDELRGFGAATVIPKPFLVDLVADALRRAAGLPHGGLPDGERRVTEQALGRLPEPYRAVYVLADIEQWSTPQIAEMLGLNLATVESRLRRARVLLGSEAAPRPRPPTD
jgi:CheY-like chemotaxis protein